MASAHEVADNEEDQPRNPGRLRVQADTAVVVAELPLDRPQLSVHTLFVGIM